MSLLTPFSQLMAEMPDKAGLQCAALIADNACTVKEALDLLQAHEAPHALYIRGGLTLMAGGPNAQSEATAMIRRAADMGFAQAQFDLGMKALRHERKEEAMRYLSAAAEQSHLEAQYALGLAYMLGDVLPMNWYEGTFLLEKAASRDHVDASFQAGRLYLEGYGVAQDFSKAEALFARAGNLGHAHGYYEAAAAQLRQRSVDRDYKKHWIMRLKEPLRETLTR